MTLSYPILEQRIAAVGLVARGGFHPVPADGLAEQGGLAVRTVILIGLTGVGHWATFVESPEYRDGRSDPLDRWSRRIIDGLARELDARALYPFDGPPWWPFQSWARRSMTLHVSPLGILIDPTFGLWHSYRGALALTIELPLPAASGAPHPCESCQTKPCLRTCPVGAVAQGRYDVDTCRQHVRSAQTGCISVGCLARRACPIGSEHAYPPAQAAFHMRAFAGLATPR